MDNFYKSCPPKMSDGRLLTNYSNPTDLNKMMMIKLGLNPASISEHVYRYKLIEKGSLIEATNSLEFRKQYTCGLLSR